MLCIFVSLPTPFCCFFTLSHSLPLSLSLSLSLGLYVNPSVDMSHSQFVSPSLPLSVYEFLSMSFSLPPPSLHICNISIGIYSLRNSLTLLSMYLYDSLYVFYCLSPSVFCPLSPIFFLYLFLPLSLFISLSLLRISLPLYVYFL
jgi:hypothetical protein